MSQRTVTVTLYGACRDLHPEPRVSLGLADTATVADLRRALPACFDGAPAARVASLLAASVFASDSTVLRDADALPADGRLALLPPVSGG